MNYDVKRGSTVVATITPEGTQKRALMGQDTLNCSFTLSSFTQFAIGDTIVAFGKTYVLNQFPKVEKVSSLQFDYDAVFEAQDYDLAKVQYMFLDDDGNPEMSDFPLTADAGRFIDLIVSNMNRASSGWSKGTVDDTATVNISFSEDNCLSALSKIAQQFETEFWIDDKVINMTKKGQLTTLTFAYGKGNGLYSIQRAPSNNKDVFSRLYVYGSTKNLPASYGHNRLTVDFIQKTDQFNNYGLIEATLICDGSNGTKEIYPHRTGTISAITDAFTFADSGMDFDLNDQLLAGVNATIKFQTGNLAGYEFTINSYNATTKTFVINSLKADNGSSLPNAGGLKPAVGDTYVLLNIEMPTSYVTAAKTELATAGNDYYDKNSNGREVYTVDCDPLYFKDKNLDTLNLGDFVGITDTAMSIDSSIRMIGIERDLQYTFKYSLTLADTASIAQIVREYFEQQNTQIIIRRNKLNDVNRARRNWRNTADLEDMVFDPEGDYYTEKIKPGSIETLYLATGAKATNFSLNGVSIITNVGGNANSLNVTAGKLVHYTLEVPNVGSIWNMTSASFTGLDPAKSYYLYAKISTTALTGVWELLENPVLVGSEAGYYRLEVGVLFAVEDGYRNSKFTSGMTYIIGDQVQTGKLVDVSGQNFINLTDGTFNFGGSTSGIDFGVTKADTLTIRGGLVQNTGGNTSPLGVNRGPYDVGATYYPGDRVYSGGSTWLQIATSSIIGSEPSLTNTDWRLDAAAGKSAPRIIYNVSEDENTAPDLNLTNSDLQGWTVGTPGDDLATILSLNDDGDVLITDTGDEILIGTETKYVWMSTEELNADGTFKDWTSPTRMTGRTGVDGPYVDVRWQVNGSPMDPPDLTNTDPDPVGWTVKQPTISGTDYLWMIQCNKLGNGVMTTLWSDPARIQGKDGAPGASLTYRGEWDDETEYRGTDKLVEAVHYAATGLYYFSRSDAGDIPVGTLPTDTDYWNEFGSQFESVATGLLLAKVAYVEKLIVGMLSTGYDPDNPKDRIVAKEGEMDIFDANTDYNDETTSTAILRLGTSMDNDHAGNPLPGIRIKGAETSPGSGNFDISLMTGNGAFVNGSGINWAILGQPDRTASFVSLLRRGNDGTPVGGVDPVAAAIVGIDQTDSQTKGNSKNYGGYFSSIFVNGQAEIISLILKSLYLNSVSVTDDYTCGDNDFAVMAYNTTSDGNITVTMPTVALSSDADFKGGRLMIFKRANSGGVTLSADSEHEFFGAGGSSTSPTFNLTSGKSMLLAFWDGSFWNISEL